MFKSVKQYLKNRRERKLRKEIVLTAIAASKGSPMFIIDELAKFIESGEVPIYLQRPPSMR